MSKGASSSSECCCFFFRLVCIILCGSVLAVECSAIPSAKRASHLGKRELERERVFPSVVRGLTSYNFIEFDSIDPPTTASPTIPVTNPVTAPAVTVPPGNQAPAIVTVPGINPVGILSPDPTNTHPGTNQVNPPVPVTNPVTTPITNPGGQPAGNPLTAYPPPSGSGTNPVMPLSPAAGGTAPAGQGQSWCIAKNGASQAALQAALDYACGIGGADCSMIQQGASCYNPATLQNHASYAFNSYYQKNPTATSCDFGGAAVITNVNPSIGSCVYPSSSLPGTSTPVNPVQTPVNPVQSPVNPVQAPVNPVPMSTPIIPPASGSTGLGNMPSPPGLGLGNPDPGTAAGGFGSSPPLLENATASMSSGLQPFTGYLLTISSVSIGSLVLGL